MKFKKKEIVEVLNHGKLELAIIVTTPPPPTFVKKVKQNSKKLLKGGGIDLDISDYIYNTITYQNGVSKENIIEKKSEHFYDHTSFLDIFPTPIQVTDEQRMALEDLYDFYHQPVDKESIKQETS